MYNLWAEDVWIPTRLIFGLSFSYANKLLLYTKTLGVSPKSEIWDDRESYQTTSFSLITLTFESSRSSKSSKERTSSSGTGTVPSSSFNWGILEHIWDLRDKTSISDSLSGISNQALKGLKGGFVARRKRIANEWVAIRVRDGGGAVSFKKWIMNIVRRSVT